MEMMNMMGGGMMGMGGMMMWPMLLGTLLLGLLFVGALVLGIRLLRSGTRQEKDASRILAERFARGEIDQEEYQERRSVLHQGR